MVYLEEFASERVHICTHLCDWRGTTSGKELEFEPARVAWAGQVPLDLLDLLDVAGLQFVFSTCACLS